MKLFLILLLIVFSIGAMAQQKSAQTVNEFFRNKTKIDKPFDLRDPFKAPGLKGEKNTIKSGYYISGKGLYTNVKEVTMPSMADIRVVGVLIGKERRAMVTAGEKGAVIILKEGMKIGDEGAELKAILPGGIILVEKIVNVYGQDEYLETVIPISK